MRRQNQSNQYTQSFRTSGQLLTTPRGSARPNIPIDVSRRSTTPSKIQDRLSNSPLKAPLQSAISRISRKQTDIQRSTSNRYLGKSNHRNQSPMISMAKKNYYQQDPQTQQSKAHPQTANFIKKYFQTINLEVPLERFIQKMMQQYETLWGTQNVDKIFDDFTYKIADIFGSEYVDLRQLVRITKQDGMIGLILRIFKQIKTQQNTRSSNYASFTQSPHVVNISRSFQQKLAENQSLGGIKNVIQQYMQTMYQAMESEIYQKFNIQMRRMIIKYRQAQKILKKVNQKLNNYADVFDFDQKMKQKQKKYQAQIQQLNKIKQKTIIDMQKQRQLGQFEKKQKQKLNQQISKLKQTLQKYQNIVLTKAMQNNKMNQSQANRQSNQSRVQGPTEPLKNSQINSNQPFKITIDTHIIHKQNVPQAKTITTFLNAPPLPINHLPRQSYQNRNIQFKATSPFSTSRVTTYRPLSPYQSRVIRPPI